MFRSRLILGIVMSVGGCSGWGGVEIQKNDTRGTALIIDDFLSGVSAVNHPDPGLYSVWYDTTHNTYGTPSADTLEGDL